MLAKPFLFLSNLMSNQTYIYIQQREYYIESARIFFGMVSCDVFRGGPEGSCKMYLSDSLS